MFIIGLDTYAQYLSNTWFFYHEYIGLYKAIDFFGSGNNVNEIQKKKNIGLHKTFATPNRMNA